MTAEMQTAAWGIAVAIPVLLNVMSKRSADALGLSGMILLTWVLSRVFWAFYEPPEAMQWYPVIDCAAGITVWAAWITRRAWWKMALVMLYVGQCITHTAFWAAWPSDGSLLRYLWVNNSLFACQLICVAYPGGRHVALRTLSWVSDRARRMDHA